MNQLCGLYALVFGFSFIWVIYGVSKGVLKRLYRDSSFIITHMVIVYRGIYGVSTEVSIEIP